MSATLLRAAASAVLYVHFAVVLFNLFFMVAVPLGAWLGWAIVRNFWWRAAHLLSLFIVAIQAAAGRFCFLTIWQNALGGAGGGVQEEPSIVDRIITRAVFWPLPMWAFVILYAAALFYTIALWWIVPPHRVRPVRGRRRLTGRITR